MTISDPVYASLAEAYDECERTVLAGPLNGKWAELGPPTLERVRP